MKKYRFNEAAEIALIAWVKTALPGFNVEWTMQDAYGSTRGRLPQLPYATLHIPGPIRKTGKADKTYKEQDTWTVTKRRTFILSINLYCVTGPLDYMTQLTDSLDNDTISEQLRVAGLAFWTHTDPVDISELMETKHELRSTADFTFAIAKEFNVKPGEVQEIGIEGTLKNNKGETKVTTIEKIEQ